MSGGNVFQRAVLLCAGLIAASGCGCTRKSEPQASDVRNEVIEAVEDIPAASVEHTVVAPSDPDSLEAIPPEPVPSESADVEQEPPASPMPTSLETATMQPAPAFDLHGDPVRVYLPTTAGPFIIDMHLHLDGKNQDSLFHEAIDSVIADAKGDSKENLDWPAIFEFVGKDPQRFGPIMQNVGNNTAELIRRSDLNRNRWVEHDELVKFLFRNNQENVAFRLRGTDYFLSVGQSNSDTFKTLDDDGDGVLNQAELDRSAFHLLQMDQNLDQRVGVDEIGVKVLDDSEVWDRRRTGRYGDVAMDLEGFVDWALVAHNLASMRGKMPFGLLENAVDALDTNRDNNISGDEAKGLLRADAHLHLLIEFSWGDSPEVRLVSAMPRVRDHVIVDADKKSQITIADDRLQLTIRVADRLDQQSRIPQEAFDQLDANDDGYLDASEVPDEASETFSIERLDQDKDEMLSLAEINQPVSGSRPLWMYQVRGRAAEAQDPLFGFLDLDHDQSLSTREIQSASQSLQSLADDSTLIRPDDIPASYRLMLVRSDPTQDAQAFRESAPTASKHPLSPWASQMDVNKDGEISRREFIGTESQFQQLDQDGDGFLDHRELKPHE